MKPNKFLKNRPGIYGIRNLVNNKIYVGKTKCMYKRCHQYVYDFRERTIGHINDYLYNAMVKNGIDNFEFFPLEFCEIENLQERELSWMTELNSVDRNHGYNLRLDSSTGMIVSKSTSGKISNTLRKQWGDGKRDGHSEKMKEYWCGNTQRRRQQSKLFSKHRTKYEYEVHHPNGQIENCQYKRLCELGIKNVISNFHKQRTNSTVCKGFRVVRFNKGE